MKQVYTDETFLARWIANDLSDTELKEFKNSDEFDEFNKINKAAQFLTVPDYDKPGVFNKITAKLQKEKKSKVINLKPWWLYSGVASIILFLSIFYYNSNNYTTFSTKYGEQIIVKLPDNSITYLSAGSNLKFTEKNWNKNRNLSLIGKAYFEVEKGKTFTVHTKKGDVVVLGTKFTVNSSNNIFEVQCFEGKVKAISKNKNEVILSKGKAFRIYQNKSENWSFIKKKPSWLNGESSFNNAPLSQVILRLKKQYNLKFDISKIDINKRFTGTFTHNNVNIALKTVFAPMNISFKLAENNLVILTYSNE